jgi:pyrroloquinoline-quinone synthase
MSDTVELSADLHQEISRLLQTWRSRDNIYFKALRNGEFSKEDFVETQIQFLAVTQYFHRPMAAVAARVPFPELRLEILRNVWEENGNGELGRTHNATFMKLLARLAGIREEDVLARPLWPEVRACNTAFAGACAFDEYFIGAAVMGMIEQMFAEVSGWIAAGIIERGWLKADEIIHYGLHEKLDIKHAADFFVVLEPAWKEPSKRYAVMQGLELGSYLFTELYDALYRARKRRVTLPPTIAAHRRTFCE